MIHYMSSAIADMALHWCTIQAFAVECGEPLFIAQFIGTAWECYYISSRFFGLHFFVVADSMGSTSAKCNQSHGMWWNNAK